MARHGSASVREHESHSGNLNLSTQLTHQNSTTQQDQLTQSLSEAVSSTLGAEMAAAGREYDLLGVPRRSDDITPDLKRRARRIAVDGRVDHATRHIIRDALESRDPYLVQLVTRVERGELKIEHLILDSD